MKYFFLIFLLLINVKSFAIESINIVKGKKLYEMQNYNDAKIEFEKNIVFNPKNIEGYLYLSKIYKHLKNIEEEEKNLRTVLLLDPKNQEALYLIINLYIEKADYEKAEQKYQFLKKVCVKCNELPKIEGLINKFKN